MRRSLVIAASLVAIVIVAGMATISSAGSRGVNRFTVIEHATTDTVIDVGDSGDSTGDLLTFHNEIFDADNQLVVGADQGDCVRIDPAEGSWECRWVTILEAGQITVEGQFLDTASTVMAVTGGTGAYKNARGTLTLNAQAGGAEYEFIFRLTG